MSAERICIVLLTGLGDVVHGLPLVNALKRQDPARHVTWVAEPMPAQLLAGHPAVDDVVVFEKKRGAAGVRDLWRALSRRRFDLALNLNIYFKSVWPTLLSRAPVRLGFDRARSRDGVWIAANRRLAPGPRRHTQDLFLEFLEWLDVPAAPLEWRLEPTPAERAARDAVLAPLEGHAVASIVPASANAKKDWTVEGYAAVVDALEHDFGVRTMLVGGPGARETAIARAVAERTSARPLWALGDGVRRVLALLEASRLVIAPDTGPVHMARAMDVPVVGLYGHTNPWRVGPYRRFEDLWVDTYTEPGEAPDPGNARPKLGRMERITPRDVLERVERALARYPARLSSLPGRLRDERPEETGDRRQATGGNTPGAEP